MLEQNRNFLETRIDQQYFLDATTLTLLANTDRWLLNNSENDSNMQQQ